MFPTMWHRSQLNVVKICNPIVLRYQNENLCRLLFRVDAPFFSFENCLLPSVYWKKKKKSSAKIIYIKIIIHCHFAYQIKVSACFLAQPALWELHSKPGQGPYVSWRHSACLRSWVLSSFCCSSQAAAGTFPVPDFPPSAVLQTELFIMRINSYQSN